MITLTLAGYRTTDTPIEGSRPFATERLYDEWIGFVIQHIDDETTHAVDVNANRFNGPPEDISGDHDGADLTDVRDALTRLWAAWRCTCGPARPELVTGPDPHLTGCPSEEP